MIINATSHTMKKIWILFLFIVLFFISVITTLENGLSIDTITLPSVKIDQLYIKLDKKLILEVQSLEINSQTKTDTSLEETATLIKNFPYLNQFFSQINIEKIVYENETFSVHFKDDLLMLESQHLRINLKITPVDTWQLNIEIQEAYLKDLFLHLHGHAFVDFKNEQYHFNGAYEFLRLKGNTQLQLNKTLLTYHLNSETFSNKTLTEVLDFIVSKVELDPIARNWIDKNIIGKEYILRSFDGKIDTKTYDYFPMEMRGQATVKDALISFEPTIPPAHAKQIGIVFKEDKLIFDITDPTYEQKKLDKADVYIYNLIGKGTGIIVDLTAKSKLDATIHKILHAFKIDVPITQSSGVTDANVRLDVKFLPYDINATGTFKLSPSTFTLSGVPMSTKAGEIKLDNFFIDLNRTNMRYKNLFDINATGTFDAKKSSFLGMIDIDSLLLDFSGTQLLNITQLTDQNASFLIENNTTTMRLPNLETAIVFAPKNNQFIVSDLQKVAPYSPFMRDNNLSQGNVLVQTKDFENFNAKIALSNLSLPLLENNQTLQSIQATLITNTKTLDAQTLDNRIAVHFDKELNVTLKDFNISMPKGDDPLDVPIRTTITGKNSSFIDRDTNKTLLSDTYALTLFKDRVVLHSKYKKSSFEYDKRKNSLKIEATGLDAEATNALFNKRYFHQGDFSLSVDGKSEKEMQGTFIMHKTYIKELKFFNNLMATINAIPSLIVFTDPNFNKEGYFVENGFLEFNQTNDYMGIQELQLRGASADITGLGDVDFAKDALNLKLQIKTLKTFSSALDMIPLVGGIILGDDKKIATHVDVTGSSDDPKIETHLILDTLKSPVNIIKRTLELPLELLK